jgi:hypothetical protein
MCEMNLMKAYILEELKDDLKKFGSFVLLPLLSTDDLNTCGSFALIPLIILRYLYVI